MGKLSLLSITLFCVVFQTISSTPIIGQEKREVPNNPLNPSAFLSFLGQQGAMKDNAGKVSEDTNNKEQFTEALNGIKDQVAKGAQDLQEKINKVVNLEENM